MKPRTRTIRSLSLTFFGLLALGLGADGCSNDPPPTNTGGSGSGSGGPVHCDSSAMCDADKGFACVEGECRVRCDSHFDCASIGECQALAGATYCVATTPAAKGQYYQRCPNGNSECDSEKDFFCYGSGPGDIDAYCTSDCAEDQDCPNGFRCGILGATPCEQACGEAGQDAAGCAPAAEIGAGKRYECHAVLGVVRHACLEQSFCSSCEKDEDCLAVPNQICARDSGGQKICTQACDPGVVSCPWGDASECGLWDQERSIYTCSHRFGACQGTGKGCEPCVDANDCPNGYCSRSSFTGEQFCVDLSVECDCGADAEAGNTCAGHGCPDSPSGIPMTCFSGTRYINDPLSHRCVSASSSPGLAATPRTGCWPPL